MSAFTKFLIVLLTVFSIFLCGIVVTYVGSQSNWKAEYNELNDQIDAIKSSLASEKRQMAKEKTQYEAKVNDLLAENSTLKSEIADMEVEVANVKRDNSVNVQRVSDATGIIEGLRQTIEGLRTSLEATRVDLTEKTTKLASMSKKLNEINTELDEKIVELDALEAENKKLVEIKADLEDMLAGKAASVKPVTQFKENVTMLPAQPLEPAYDSANIKALVSEVDLKNKLVTVTVGAADGVAQGMRFHVTRGDQFVCDMVVTHVDQDRAAGVLELIQAYPKIGDNVSTSL